MWPAIEQHVTARPESPVIPTSTRSPCSGPGSSWGSVDTIIFHQLLQWHNFYYDTTDYWQVFSDGLLHAFIATMLFFGAVRLWSQRREAARLFSEVPLWTGVLLGAGGFQLFDGIIDHKVLRLHQIREEASNQLPYDIAWNLFALAALAAGWLLWQRRDKEANIA